MAPEFESRATSNGHLRSLGVGLLTVTAIAACEWVFRPSVNELDSDFVPQDGPANVVPTESLSHELLNTVPRESAENKELNPSTDTQLLDLAPRPLSAPELFTYFRSVIENQFIARKDADHRFSEFIDAPAYRFDLLLSEKDLSNFKPVVGDLRVAATSRALLLPYIYKQIVLSASPQDQDHIFNDLADAYLSARAEESKTALDSNPMNARADALKHRLFYASLIRIHLHLSNEPLTEAAQAAFQKIFNTAATNSYDVSDMIFPRMQAERRSPGTSRFDLPTSSIANLPGIAQITRLINEWSSYNGTDIEFLETRVKPAFLNEELPGIGISQKQSDALKAYLTLTQIMEKMEALPTDYRITLPEGIWTGIIIGDRTGGSTPRVQKFEWMFAEILARRGDEKCIEHLKNFVATEWSDPNSPENQVVNAPRVVLNQLISNGRVDLSDQTELTRLHISDFDRLELIRLARQPELADMSEQVMLRLNEFRVNPTATDELFIAESLIRTAESNPEKYLNWINTGDILSTDFPIGIQRAVLIAGLRAISRGQPGARDASSLVQKLAQYALHAEKNEAAVTMLILFEMSQANTGNPHEHEPAAGLLSTISNIKNHPANLEALLLHQLLHKPNTNNEVDYLAARTRINLVLANFKNLPIGIHWQEVNLLQNATNRCLADLHL